MLDEIDEELRAFVEAEMLHPTCGNAIRHFVYDIFLQPAPEVAVVDVEELRHDPIFAALRLYLAPNTVALGKWLSFLWEDQGVRVEQHAHVIELAARLAAQ